MRYRHIRNENGDPIATLASEPLDEDIVVFSLARAGYSDKVEFDGSSQPCG